MRSAPRPNDSWAALASKFDIYKLFWQAGFLHPASFPLLQLTELGHSGWVWEALPPGDAAAEGTPPAVPGAWWPRGCSGEVGTRRVLRGWQGG